MADSQLNLAEWRCQRLFSKLLIVGAFLLLAGSSRFLLPDREPGPDRTVRLLLEPVKLDRSEGEGVTLTGAWKLCADDRRVEGLSALAVLADGRLQALSDSGALVSFFPGLGKSRAKVSELPAGPGYPTFKKYRDSEAMIVSPDGRHRWVTFEYRHSLWRFNAYGRAQRLPIALPSADWRRNSGIEAMVLDPADGRLLLLHEGGRVILRLTGGRVPQELPLSGATGGIADAVRLPDGRMVVAVREIGLRGLTNRLAWLERAGAGYRLRNFATLPLGPFDNVEGLAAERSPDGATRLWAITDSDGWRRTLLVGVVLDTTKAPTDAGA